jgi:hypothetical protein
MSKDQTERAAREDGSAKKEGEPSLGGRIVFWALLIYTLALAVMVIEDMLNHTMF